MKIPFKSKYQKTTALNRDGHKQDIYVEGESTNEIETGYVKTDIVKDGHTVRGIYTREDDWRN